MTTNGLLLAILIILILGVWTASRRLEEIVDGLKEIKDTSDVILGSIERIERDLRGHE